MSVSQNCRSVTLSQRKHSTRSTISSITLTEKINVSLNNLAKQRYDSDTPAEGDNLVFKDWHHYCDCDSPTVTRLHVVTTDLGSEFAATWSWTTSAYVTSSTTITSQKNYRRDLSNFILWVCFFFYKHSTSRAKARFLSICSGNFLNVDSCTNVNNVQRRHWTWLVSRLT